MTRNPRAQWVLLALLVLSWPVMLYLLWSAFWTLPPPEVLAERRFVQPPTFATLRRNVLVSAGELTALAAWLWPGRFYAARLLASPLALALYFVFTTPLGLTTVDQVHRRWLALWVVLLGLAALLSLGRGAVRRLRG